MSTAIYAQSLPDALKKANEAIALGERWVLLDKSGLKLIDVNGAERVKMRFRGKHLDARRVNDNILAIAMDSDTQAPRVLRATAAGVTQQTLAVPTFVVDALCLYRDRQQLDHVFLIAKDGQAEQWLLTETSHLVVRKLALQPHSRHCRVDDIAGTLYVSEARMGLWAYDIGGEGIPTRSPVALRKPYGVLSEGAGAVQPLPYGVAVLDGTGKTLHVFRQSSDAWQKAKTLSLKAQHDQLTLMGSSSPLQLAARLADKSWQTLSLPNIAAAEPPRKDVPIVMPRVQTDPMTRLGDAADDPAIWIHPADPTRSRVLGTNKKQGLLVYDLQGKQQQLLEVGRLNNVDLRQRVQLGASTEDLAVATHRDDLSLVVFGIDAEGAVSERARIPTGLPNIYGLCVFQPRSGGLEIFVNDKSGLFQQYRLSNAAGAITGTQVRQFKVATQPEGCVVDDASERLFLGEEKRGLWVTSARADQPARMDMILPVGHTLVADVEGMAIYQAGEKSYLIVSSQGNDSYVVLDAKPPFAVRGVFRIGINPSAGIDGTSETDGLDVTAANLGGPFSQGMLVVQDGYKRLPDGPQNFKYVAWEDVTRALNLR